MEKKHVCLYDISTKAYSDRVNQAEALENVSQEMNVAGWYITHHNAALGTKTRLTCFALIGCTLFNRVSCIADRRRQLSCVDEGVYSDATQLNSSCVAINGPLLCAQVMLRRPESETKPAGRHSAYGLTLTGGRPVTVGRVRPGGAAFVAGLRPGDVICRVNGHCVVTASTDSVARILRYSFLSNIL